MSSTGPLLLPVVGGCETLDIDFEEARREVRRLLCDAVDRRLMADVPVGAFLLSEMTRQHVTVALSGDGGDELFGGYERFAAAITLDRARVVPGGVVHAAQLCGRCPRRCSAAASGASTACSPAPEPTRSTPTCRGSAACRLTGGGYGRRHRTGLTSSTEPRGKRPMGLAFLDRLLHLNSGTYLLDDLLPKVDRMTMAHGLEVRSPLLDTELAEFAVRLPPAHKVRGLSLKRVLKAAVRDLLPPSVLHRRKRGFGVPLDRWFRTDLRSYVEAQLLSQRARVASYCDGDAVRALVAQHQAGTDGCVGSLLTMSMLNERRQVSAGQGAHTLRRDFPSLPGSYELWMSVHAARWASH